MKCWVVVYVRILQVLVRIQGNLVGDPLLGQANGMIVLSLPLPYISLVFDPR